MKSTQSLIKENQLLAFKKFVKKQRKGNLDTVEVNDNIFQYTTKAGNVRKFQPTNKFDSSIYVDGFHFEEIEEKEKSNDVKYQENLKAKSEIFTQLKIAEKHNVQEKSLTVSSFYDDYDKIRYSMACFTTTEGDHILIHSRFPETPELQYLSEVETIYTPELINAEECEYNKKIFGEWVFRNFTPISELEVPYPRSEILKYAKKEKLTPTEIKKCREYYHHYSPAFFHDTYGESFKGIGVTSQILMDGFSKERLVSLGYGGYLHNPDIKRILTDKKTVIQKTKKR